MRRSIGEHLHPLLQSSVLGLRALVQALHLLQFVLGVALGLRGASQQRLQLDVLLLERGVLAKQVLERRYGRLGQLLLEEQGGQFLVEIFRFVGG